MARAAGDLERAIAEVQRGPLAEFVAARNALAKDAAKRGQTADAARVRALAKPSVSAWVIARLFELEPGKMAKLLAAGEKARAALSSAIAHGEIARLRQSAGGTRELVETLTERAVAIVTEETGKRPSAAIVERIGTNLSTLALSPVAAAAAERGWLERDLDPPGLEVLEAMPAAVAGHARRASATRAKQGAREKADARARAEAKARADAAARADAKAREVAEARQRARAEAAEEARAEAAERARAKAEREERKREARDDAQQKRAKAAGEEAARGKATRGTATRGTATRGEPATTRQTTARAATRRRGTPPANEAAARRAAERADRLRSAAERARRAAEAAIRRAEEAAAAARRAERDARR
jgi:colicin import membrane protein